MSGAIIVMVGRPGAGKDAQGLLIAKHLGGGVADMGGYMREPAQQAVVGRYTAEGLLVPDGMTCRMFDALCSSVATKISGLIVDRPLVCTGFPRTTEQAIHLLRIGKEQRRPIRFVTIYLRLSREQAIRRVLGRLDGRVDDSDMEIVNRRQDVFERQFLGSGGLLDFLRLNTTFMQFDSSDGNSGVEEVLSREESIQRMFGMILPPLCGAIGVGVPDQFVSGSALASA